MKKLLRRSILLLASVLLLATAVFAGGGLELIEMTPAEGFVRTATEYYRLDETNELGDPYITEKFSYDSYGNLVSQYYKDKFETENSGEYVYTYDEDGKIVSVDVSEHSSSYGVVEDNQYFDQYTYDMNGKLISITTYRNGEETWKEYYQYDDFGRLISVDYSWYYEGTECREPELEYQYDDAGNLVMETQYWEGMVFCVYEYQYDNDGNLVEKKFGDEKESYRYDDDGKLVWESDWERELYYEYNSDGRCNTINHVCYDEFETNYKTDYIYDENGNNIRADFYIGWNEDGTYQTRFVCLYAYEYIGTDEEPEPEPEEVQFTDLVENSTYYDSVLWAVEKGITKGTSETEFSPKEDCTRAQIVTFLWRYAGEPEPTSTEHNFVDLVEDSSYYKAVLWAVEKGITNGVDDTHFGPKEPCTRAQIVTFLWRAAGKPEPSSQQHSFEDIVEGSSYYDAVLWAVEKGITTGADTTHFNPKDTCTRAQGMTFLWRYNNTK